MKTRLITAGLVAGIALAACSGSRPEPASATSGTPSGPAAAPETAPSRPAATTTAEAAMPEMAPETHAAMEAAQHAQDARRGAVTDGGTHDDAAATAQAGWYTAGTFRACGSTAALTLDKAADIDARIKAEGMSPTDPVYVRLEGMPMGDGQYMVTRIVQVGAKSPVRDCPMTGTTVQSGG